MTVDTLVAAPVILPRINLLPQEINEANTARKAKAGLGAVIVAAALGTGYLYMSASSSAVDAQTKLDAAAAQTRTLQQQVAQHNTVAPVKAELAARSALISGAMANNVPWAFYLADVQLDLPRGARLVTWSMALSPATTAGAPATVFGSNGVATWTITGEAKRYEDVALVIESIAQLDPVDSVFVSSATTAVDAISGRSIVNFSLSARMNDKAVVPYSLKAGR
ncbi:MAG: type pilus assembly protein PilN [Thermoleophilaceae bacterium]|nr:type pilus assembly protein PilN [Thermoleophilaceae bacterium]